MTEDLTFQVTKDGVPISHKEKKKELTFVKKKKASKTKRVKKKGLRWKSGGSFKSLFKI